MRLKDEKEIEISDAPGAAITQEQSSLLPYDAGPSEIVPDTAPEDEVMTDFPEHEHEPEHVTVADDMKLEYEPAAQALHVELPFVSEYVPSVHGIHAARP